MEYLKPVYTIYYEQYFKKDFNFFDDSSDNERWIGDNYPQIIDAFKRYHDSQKDYYHYVITGVRYEGEWPI